MGISRDSRHKRRHTGGRRKVHQKKRKYELGRPSANTKIGKKEVRVIRTRGGNKKFRGLRLETGNFSWGSEGCTRKSRILDVVYNASDNELLRTKTLVKNAVIVVDGMLGGLALHTHTHTITHARYTRAARATSISLYYRTSWQI